MEKLIRAAMNRPFQTGTLIRSNLEAALHTAQADHIVTATFDEDECIFINAARRAGLPAIELDDLRRLVCQAHAQIDASEQPDRSCAHTRVSVEENVGTERMRVLLCAIFADAPIERPECVRVALATCAYMLARVIERNLEHDNSVAKIRRRLERTIRDRAFSTVYQPIVRLADGRIAGFEALTRFDDAKELTPDRWFAQAIEIGVQDMFEHAVMRQALEGLTAMPDDAYISLNVSPETILYGTLDRALEGAPLERIMLEVTEHASVDNYQDIADLLKPFRDHGMRLAVDDAGAGYASFRHILKLQPDIIKLDRSLIERIDEDVGARALTAAVTRFCEETCCTVVAEGVETEAELDALRNLKVGKAQGYLIGRPGALAQWVQ